MQISKPDWAALNNRANALKLAGQPDRAVPLYTQAFTLAPTELEPPYNLALALIDLGRFADAEVFLRHALTLAPSHSLAHHNLANILSAQNRLAEAENHYRAALDSAPPDPESAAKLHNNLALCLRCLHRLADAEHHYRAALTLNPNYATAWCNFGDFLAQHGQMDSAVAALRHALVLDPNHAAAHSNLLFTLGHTNIAPDALLAEHLAFADRFETPLLAEQFYPLSEKTSLPYLPACLSFSPDRPTETRPLRLGFVSADLRDHPLVRYLRPALTALLAEPGLTLVAYNNHPLRDAETAAYQQQFHEWRNVAHLSDAALATLIHRDRIDILFDLAGHSGFNRLLTFARRPAPVQISWMGYVGTTGLRSMDYFIADEHLIPPAMAWQFTEQLLRVPATTNFAPCEDAPPVNELPALTAGVFTFASLARPNKLSQPLIAVWAQVLHGAPNSRLMLATLPDGTPPPTVLAWFAEQGITPSRLWFVHPRSVQEMLLLHHHIDLGLDTFPYTGSTTNNHGAWMGVPTLTLPGAIPTTRMGTALNLHLGLGKWIADDRESYVRLAVRFAGELSVLAEIRARLRSDMAASVLCASPTPVPADLAAMQ